ncbi:uncharacterized protein LOC115555913 [Gadus morhua]|uniref:uncharacterized protein LOC115555913 n=1 Tax=Gadus morhua TaxID=8049 RepID=UPI0011B6B870|nr:uncharacterized protein LOC115555913 [Gadus morhua]
MFVRLLFSICLLVGQRAHAQTTPSSKNITEVTAQSVFLSTDGTTPATFSIIISNTTSPPVDEILLTTQNTTNESATGSSFLLKFTLVTAFDINLLNRSSVEFQTFKNQTESILNYILSSRYGNLFNIATVNSFGPGSGTVVNADLDFNNEAGISADAVKNTLALAASELDLPIAVNVSSINVIARSPVIEPSQNSTIKVFADVRIFSSIKLNASNLGFMIEVLGSNIGPLQVTVKKIVSCLGDQC